MIKSLCTLATYHNLNELLLMLYSFRQFHSDIPVYIYCDMKTAAYNNEFQKLGNIGFHATKSMDVDSSNDEGWLKLMLYKTNVMDEALELYENTLFVDSDLIFLDSITDLFFEYSDLILSPHRIVKSEEDKHGRYNGGFVATNNKSFPQWWRDATAKNPKFFEQYCLNNAEQDFEVKIAPPWHNFGWFRVSPWHQENYLNALQFLAIDDDDSLCYDGVKISSVHTHLQNREPRFQVLNKILGRAFAESSNPHYKAIGKYANSLGLL